MNAALSCTQQTESYHFMRSVRFMVPLGRTIVPLGSKIGRLSGPRNDTRSILLPVIISSPHFLSVFEFESLGVISLLFLSIAHLTRHVPELHFWFPCCLAHAKDRIPVTQTHPITTAVTIKRTSLATPTMEGLIVMVWIWLMAPECVAAKAKDSIFCPAELGMGTDFTSLV